MNRPLTWRTHAVLDVDPEDANPKLHCVRLRRIGAHPTLRLNCLHGVADDLLHCILRAVLLNEQFRANALPHSGNALLLLRRQLTWETNP